MNIEKIDLYKKIGMSWDIVKANEYFSNEEKIEKESKVLYWMYISWGLNLSDNGDDDSCIEKMYKAINIIDENEVAHLIAADKLARKSKFDLSICHLMLCDKKDELFKRTFKFICEKIECISLYDELYNKLNYDHQI